MRPTTRQTLQNVASAVFVSVLLQPLDVVRALQMTHKRTPQMAYKRTPQKDIWAVQTACRLAREKGIQRVYTGVGLTAVSAAVNWGIFRSIYESLRNSSFLDHTRVAKVAIASTVASASTIVIAYPFYNLKTELVVRGSGE
eukprot:Gregarina_sp_Pseudo_9__3596@NODE_3758_length_565_cov_118_847909_g3441_i0_p1_GENE_NODE_3758_length_565_cov_118_847909_g3441_i0NODE_3758_length_565_cov_118_847909_g3441_i0_p1_ORF_typecomplete_len141_score11_69Mito_carr/PF00153_27/8_4e10Mito_carr/PF00153_27/0_43_NODE_3758_length_565_cov_118_847909_g3441_i068490